MERIVRDLVDWIEIPSVTGQEADAGDALARALERDGFSVERQEVAPGRSNVLARAGRPEVVFCTHVDTVPPHFGSRIEGSVVFGRGSCDAKGQASAMLEAGRRLLAAGEDRIGFLFTVGEEVDSVGAQAANAALDDPSFRDAWQPRWTIIGEPTDNTYVRGHKGLVYARLEARGVAGHSSQDVGPSAVHELIEAGARILGQQWGTDPELGHGTVNLGRIEGGVAPNVVADRAGADVLVRTVEEPGVVQARIDCCLGAHVSAHYVQEAYAPVRFRVPDGEDSIAVAFGTDAPHMRRWGMPLLFGAGSIRDAHTDDEKVRVAELEDCAGRHVRTTLELLQAVDAEVSR